LGDLCNDGNPCTRDACDSLLFCIFPPVSAGLACNDFLHCTTPDQCDGLGTCRGVSVCDDGIPCTDDHGDEANACACTNRPSFPGTTCNDNDACTTGEACDGFGTIASCNGGATVNCDDHDPCTDDSCDPGTGCGHTYNTNPCSDGNACTAGDTCGGGTCNPGGPTNCDDGQCCTIDACNPSSGCFYKENTARPVIVNQPSLGACAILWPPQHGYVDFTVADTGATATSQCGIAKIEFASCHSSQPDNGNGVGDGNSTRDCVYEPGALHLRAERDGACSPIGRNYSSTVVATDACGNTSLPSNSFDVGVWHDRSHQPDGPYISASPGSNQNDQRLGLPGTWDLGCGGGTCFEAGQAHDSSDADPEMEIDQSASIAVNDLHLEKAIGGNVKLTWSEPHQAGIIVTRFHVYRLDPVTLFWTQIAEVTKQTDSYLDAVLNDGLSHDYKVAAVIK
jgi:hypothetical protein